MIKSITLALLLLVGSAWSITTNAGIINLTASLDGAQAGNATTGTGSAFITLDDSSGLLHWNIAWTGLTGPATSLHFHGPAAPGSVAGVQVNLGAISGLVSASIGSTIISATQSADMLSGLWYINIHTAAFGSGEIRGQVNLGNVPSPTAFWLLGFGLVTLAARLSAPRPHKNKPPRRLILSS